MHKLFDYSNIAEGSSFIGREDELKRLSSDFIFLTNTVVTAPQGWGKSSLIHRAAQDARQKSKDHRFCFVELSNVRNEERFYELLVQGILKSVSGTQTEVVENVRKYFSDVSPKVSFDPSGSFSVSLDWEEIRRNKDGLIDLPFVVARDKGVKLVVCIDDFQAVNCFAEPEDLLERLKSRWAKHENVAYCISTTRIAIVEKFIKSSPMFYRYADFLDLKQLSKSSVVRSLRDRFADSAKYLDDEMASLIVEKSCGNAFYMIQLAHLSWLATSVVCSREVVEASFESIVDQMGLVFRNIAENLTGQQLCYLHAVIAGETVISTSEVLHRHHISSATSASRSKAALLERGIIVNIDGKVCMADPIFAYWLKNRYFN